jgi:hypothetical protein
MGCFEALPNDVMWLVLRQVVRLNSSEWVKDELDKPWWSYTSKPFYKPFSFDEPNRYMAQVLIKLSLVSKRVRRILKSKCRKSQYSSGGFCFIAGAFS